MIKYVLFAVSLLILFTHKLHAQDKKTVNSTDTFHITKADYKLSKNQFYDRYGIDDTARALIRIYFEDRTIGFCVLPAYPAFIIIPGLFIKNATPSDIFIGPHSGATAVAGITTLAGVYFLAGNSRKALCKELKFYITHHYILETDRSRVIQKIFKMRKQQKK